MKRFLSILPPALTLLLAACGGPTSTPTPTPEPTPIPTPAPIPEPIPVPAPPTTPTPIPPTTPDVEYYGEWEWVFDLDNLSVDLTGRVSMVESVATEGVIGSRGGYQLCPCDGVPIRIGTGVLGTYLLSSGDRLGFGLVNELSDESYVQLIGFDSDGVIGTNTNGQEILEGSGQFTITSVGDPIDGTFTLTKISDLPVIQD